MLRLLFNPVVLLLIAATVYLFMRNRSRIAKRAGSVMRRPAPYCPKCESNRQVVENPGDRYPQDKFPWYCQRCEEAF